MKTQQKAVTCSVSDRFIKPIKYKDFSRFLKKAIVMVLGGKNNWCECEGKGNMQSATSIALYYN